MKYIESEVMLAAMVLGMYQNNQDCISDDEAEKFGMDYISGLKEKYFPNEPLISDHISHKTIIYFYEKYPDQLSYSFLQKKLFVKYLPPEEEAMFKAILTVTVASWCDKVNLNAWYRGAQPLFSFEKMNFE